MQVLPSGDNTKPVSQLHAYEPSELLHCCWHPPLSTSHSFTSVCDRQPVPYISQSINQSVVLFLPQRTWLVKLNRLTIEKKTRDIIRQTRIGYYQWRRSVINLGGSTVQAWGHLSPSANPPFSFPLVDSQAVLTEPAHPLPNILMQFMQPNSFIKFKLMFNVLPGTEIIVYAEFSQCRQNWYWITGHF